MEHRHHHKQETTKPGVHSKSINHFKLALQATFHCLLGCGLGEIAGMVISAALNTDMTVSLVISIIMGFAGGLALGIIPLLKNGFTLRNAVRTVIIAEGLSIAVMEAFEVGTQVVIPGVMEAGLSDGIFWLGMGAGLVVGFIAAFPVNYIMIKRGVRHQH